MPEQDLPKCFMGCTPASALPTHWDHPLNTAVVFNKKFTIFKFFFSLTVWFAWQIDKLSRNDVDISSHCWFILLFQHIWGTKKWIPSLQRFTDIPYLQGSPWHSFGCSLVVPSFWNYTKNIPKGISYCSLTTAMSAFGKVSVAQRAINILKYSTILWTELFLFVILVIFVQQPEHLRTLGFPGSFSGYSHLSFFQLILWLGKALLSKM